MWWFNRMVSGVVIAAALAAVLVSAPRAQAAEPLFTPDCTTDNLLARKLPVQRQDLARNFPQITDEAVAPDGAQWDSPVAVLFETPAGSVTYDLGQPTSVSAFYVQADANDIYKIWGSPDGSPGSFKLLVEVDTVNGHGLRGRAINIPPATTRFLRIGEGNGDGFYSISEFAAYCRAPAVFPPQFRKVDAPAARVPDVPWWKLMWWDNEVSARFEMLLALAGMALIIWGIALAKKNMSDHQQVWRRRAMIALGVLSFGAYWNFGFFHFRNYIHIWDTYHYYMGSKYFPELSYDRLYDCVSIADAEVPDLRRRVELRKIMNLRTNMMGPTTDILAHPEQCKAHFTPERWESFKRDVAFFRNAHGVKRWEEAQTDHGYNATPVWNILGTILTNLAPASDTQIDALSLLDPSYAIGMMVMIWWAFGWRTLAVALAVFATNFPSRFYWTGGSLLRWDWLFYMAGGVCLVRKEKYLLGGFFLSYSTMLRIFPVFLFVGPLMLLVQEYLKTRKIDVRLRGLVLGAALAVAILFPLSLVKSSGIEGWVHFKQNSAKHTQTPLTNYMGLRTAIAYAPSEAGKYLRNDRLDDPWHDWKLAKLKTFRQRVALFVVAAAGFAVLLWYAVRGVEPWVACALSATLIAVGVELTCYYYSFLIVVALLYEKRKEAGAALLGVTAATSFIDWAPTRFLPDTGILRWMKMPTWLDEQYMWMGFVTLAAFAWILYRFGFTTESGPVAALAGAPAGAGTSDVPAAAAGAGAPAAAERRPSADKDKDKDKEKEKDKGRSGPRRSNRRHRRRN